MNSLTDKEKLDKLVERIKHMHDRAKAIKHMHDRAKASSDSSGELNPTIHTVWRGWDKGYTDGIISACESILDFIEHINKE